MFHRKYALILLIQMLERLLSKGRNAAVVQTLNMDLGLTRTERKGRKREREKKPERFHKD